METQKKRRGDRKDGRLLRELDSLHFITGIIYPNRCDNEAYVSERIDLTAMNAYLAEKNQTETEFPYTMFHLVVAALLKTITLRPKLNRFIVNSNFYQRNEVSAAFVVKKQFSDKGAEALAVLHSREDNTLEDVHAYIRRQVTECRSEKVDPTTGVMDYLNKIPRFISKTAIRILMWLDKHGWVPADIIATDPMFRPGDRMLAAMPLFHGFGLGVCVHSMLSQGGRCILIPRFTAKSYAKQIVKYKCNFIAGVPTLYEALLRLPSMDNADLSSLKGVFSGGDSLSIELKKKFDKFLYDHKAVIQVREGYGTTETVTACCLTPTNIYKEGSIGLPFPDTYIKIVKPDTDEEVPYGEEGEILLAGPTVMKAYMNNPEETAKTLRKHADGLTWVYTGDLGSMDEQGFIYFKGRAKRMIISSGYNVYPGQIENILDANENVQMSCVIGVPDAYKMQKVKAFVTLKPGVPADDNTKQELLAYCRKHIAKYAMPYDIEFRDELPKTLVGKVAYRVLEEEEKAKLAAQQSGM